MKKLKKFFYINIIPCCIAVISFFISKEIFESSVHLDNAPLSKNEIIINSIGVSFIFYMLTFLILIILSILIYGANYDGDSNDYFDCTGGAGGIM